MANLRVQYPVKEVRITELVFQKTEPWKHARPAPTPVFYVQNVNFKYVSRLGAVDPDGAGQGMNSIAVDGQKVFDTCAWRHLAAAGVEAAHVHRISG
jgi:hypothetical protein